MGKAVALEKKGRLCDSDVQKCRPLPPPPTPLPQQRQQSDRKRNLSASQPALNSNPKSTPRRITRRYVSLLERKEEEEEDDEEKEEAEEEEDDNGYVDDERRKEKKLKLVLRLNRSSRPRSSRPRSPSSLGNSRDRTTEDEAPGSDSNEESESGERPPKKRTIDSVTEKGKANPGNGSAAERMSVVEEGKHGQNGDRTTGRTSSRSLTGTLLPNEKLLLFILEQLQKKDTYGVFSEPVDPEELPDYHDVIEHPMDFSTVRKKLSTGVYTTLEQFESDAFLICSNAMRYNAPETIYFRQARSIQELAKKNFQNIRQSGDGTEQDFRPQRGRPSLFKKFMQQSATKPSVESAAAVTNAGGDNSACHNHTKKQSVSQKLCSLPDACGKVTLSFLDSDMSISFTENKFAKNDEASGVMLRVVNVKHGRKPFISEENRRETYNISSWSSNRRDSVWAGLGIEKRQLMPVGLHVEHAYARSLARFAASLGPIVWKIAACKIERVLPSGMRFGPGWIGETESPPSKKSPVKTSSSIASPTVESSCDTPEVILPSRRPVSEGHISPKISQGDPPAVNGTGSLLSKENSDTLFSHGMYNAKVPLQNHQNSGIQVSHNGFMTRFPLPPMVKPGHHNSAIGPGRSQCNVGPTSSKIIADAVTSAHLLDAVSRSSNSNATGMVPLEPQQPGLVDGKISIHGSNDPPPECATEGRDHNDNPVGSINSSHLQTGWRWPSLHQKPDSTPPDLNIGFQSPASPVQQSSGVLMDSQQPDLALQL